MITGVPDCAVRRAGRGLLVGMVCALAQTSQARAQDRFEVPASCGSERELDQELTKLVNSSPAAQRPRVELTSTVDAFRLEVATRDGPRVLSDPDCRVLFRTAVLIVALAMADEQATDHGKATVAPTPEGDRTDAPPTYNEEAAISSNTADAAPTPGPPTVRSRVRGRASNPWFGTASVVAGVAAGLVPMFGAGLGLSAGLQRGAWGVLLGARYLTPREQLNRNAQGVRVDAFTANLSLTFDPTAAWGLGVGLEGAALRGQGSPNLASQQTEFVWLYGPRLQGVWRPLRSSYVDLELGLAGSYFPDNARFQFNDGRLMYATSHISGEGWLGAHWRFP
jgi:hypothetical protein